MAFSGNGDSPGDIFRAAPLGRDAFSGADTVAAWPTPARPVFGPDQPCHKKEQHKQTHAMSLAPPPSGTRINFPFVQSGAEVMPRVRGVAVYNVAQVSLDSCFAFHHAGWASDGGTTLVVATIETHGASAGW